MLNKQLFNELFSELTKIKFPYCIMNGYENYPNQIGSDIDIIVESIDNFFIVLKQLSCKLDFKIIQSLNHSFKTSNYYISKEFNEEVVILSLDVYQNYVVKERLLFKSNYFLADKVLLKNFFIPSKRKEFLYYFIKKIIKQDIDNKLDWLFSNYDKQVSFRSFFKNDYSNIETAFQLKDKEYFSNNKEILLRDLLRSTNVSLILRFKNFIRLYKRIAYPTGLIISFLGPDGSGKSTIINILKERSLPFRRIDYFHLKPAILSRKGNGQTVINPHEKKPYWGFLSYLKLGHFSLDYIFGYFIKILPLKIKSALVIFDRYYDDLLVDPKRYRYGGSILFASMTRFFIPKPDLCFVLIADEDVIYKRKQEVELNELTRQLKSYNSLIDGKQYVYIDVNREVNEIVNEIEKIIYNKMNERF
ncbi:hypothetical protein OAJ65_01705 [Flavobacteriales bacterium]|nr:hypothetical protein [Flavobacteriales bacterium]